MSGKITQFKAKDAFNGTNPATAKLKPEYMPTFTHKVVPGGFGTVTYIQINGGKGIMMIIENTKSLFKIASTLVVNNVKQDLMGMTLYQDKEVTFETRYIYELQKSAEKYIKETISKEKNDSILGGNMFNTNGTIVGTRGMCVDHLTEKVENGEVVVFQLEKERPHKTTGKMKPVYRNINKITFDLKKEKDGKGVYVTKTPLTIEGPQLVKNQYKVMEDKPGCIIRNYYNQIELAKYKTRQDSEEYKKALEKIREEEKIEYDFTNIDRYIPGGTEIKMIYLQFRQFIISKSGGLSLKPFAKHIYYGTCGHVSEGPEFELDPEIANAQPPTEEIEMNVDFGGEKIINGN